MRLAYEARLAPSLLGWAMLAAWSAGCGLLATGSGQSAPTKQGAGEARPSAVAVEMPWDTTAVRDDAAAPIVRLAIFGGVDKPSAVPYLYGYPIYPLGDAARGILKLRTDNWQDAETEQVEDEHGVVHRTEHLPQLGCTVRGIEQTPTTFVPVSLSCELPPPAQLGGAERPVIADLRAGASAKQLSALALVDQAFLGDWHLIEGNLERSGEGLFNTDHGQLAFGFERGQLARVTYYFDAPEARWQAPELWMQP